MISDSILAEKVALETNSGYWKVNNHYFFNKAECMRYASAIKDYNVTFHYFDHVFHSLKWDIEPRETLDELYKRRAQQLRDKYDYIALAFSGGSDSSNVLDTFIENGIHIDEVITTYPISASDKLITDWDGKDDSPGNLAFEYYTAAMPKLRKLAKTNPEVKITVLDHTPTAIDVIGSGNLHNLPVSGFGTGPQLAGHYLIARRLREITGKGKVCLLTGPDKPRMGYHPITKTFWVWFDDVSFAWGHYTAEAHGGFQPSVEYFYYTIDIPELWQKQCFLFREAVRPVVQLRPRPMFYDAMHFVNRKGYEIFYVHNNFFKKIIYKNWDVNTFQATKPSGYFFQEVNNWFLNTSLTEKRIKDYHYGQVLEFVHGVDPQFLVYERGTKKPLKFIESNTKPICIGR